MIQSYEDISAYQKSYQLALKVYELAKKLPKEERYGLIDQIKRAALSIPLNIAEGYGKRSSVLDFKRFLSMSMGSCNEMLVLLHFTLDMQYIEQAEYEGLKAGYDEAAKMLHGLIKNWK